MHPIIVLSTIIHQRSTNPSHFLTNHQMINQSIPVEILNHIRTLADPVTDSVLKRTSKNMMSFNTKRTFIINELRDIKALTAYKNSIRPNHKCIIICSDSVLINNDVFKNLEVYALKITSKVRGSYIDASDIPSKHLKVLHLEDLNVIKSNILNDFGALEVLSLKRCSMVNYRSSVYEKNPTKYHGDMLSTARDAYNDIDICIPSLKVLNIIDCGSTYFTINDDKNVVSKYANIHSLTIHNSSCIIIKATMPKLTLISISMFIHVSKSASDYGMLLLGEHPSVMIIDLTKHMTTIDAHTRACVFINIPKKKSKKSFSLKIIKIIKKIFSPGKK